MIRASAFSLGLTVLLPCTAIPALADGVDAAQSFYRLCVQGDFLTDPTRQPKGFPGALSAHVGPMAYSLPPGATIETNTTWELRPGATSGAGLLLAAVAIDHRTMGPMRGCLLMIEKASMDEAELELVRLGAEREGDFVFITRNPAVWMVRLASVGLSGESIIMGFRSSE